MPEPTRLMRGGMLPILTFVALPLLPSGVAAQDVGAGSQSDSLGAADSVAAPPAPGLPIFLTLGLGYGQRSDPCAFCTSPENTNSFTAHLSLGRKLPSGIGVGVDMSVWQRSHPGPLVEDETAAESGPTAMPLTNRLANLSLVFSYQAWHVFLRGGAGIALGWQDMEETGGTAEDPASSVVTASGKGVGYTVGGGITIPVHSLVSVAAFANWNRGTYDLTSIHGVLQRGAMHEYVEVGFGISLR